MAEQAVSERLSRSSWQVIDRLKSTRSSALSSLERAFRAFLGQSISKKQVLEHLEFLSEEQIFYDSFVVPASLDEMQQVGSGGKVVTEYYLLDRWIAGEHAGLFRDQVDLISRPVWQMSKVLRQEKYSEWRTAILKESADMVIDMAKRYDEAQAALQDMFAQRRINVVRSKRIIGCTTTGAAMSAQELQSVNPGIILVEEAGEVLESHILTAIGQRTKQLIMIGDHKQLRPKVNSYKLTVEGGEGYDLNRSLFERMILAGSPFTTLAQQHRMRPEISSLVRQLTYPNLLDAPSTRNRADMRGFTDNLIFFDHENPEESASELAERRDQNAKASKRNAFEVAMVLSCLRYLAQQGYSTGDVVVLTPYLGQLQLLRSTLSEEHCPILNDMDSYDLKRAGLLSTGVATPAKKPIKISTIGKH